MSIEKPDYQLSFELNLPEDEAGNSNLSAEEIRLRSETARQALEGDANLPWIEDFRKLRDGGWNWRVAAYIAWASTPKIGREPKTQDELARNHLGLTSDRQITEWRKNNAAIDEMVAILQSAPLYEERADQFKALNEGARKAGEDYKYFNHLKLAMEMRNDYIPTAKLAAMLAKAGPNEGDASDWSEEELEVIARFLKRDIVNKEKKSEDVDEQ